MTTKEIFEKEWGLWNQRPEGVCGLQFAVCSSDEKVCGLQFAVCSDGGASFSRANSEREGKTALSSTANCKLQTANSLQPQTANCKLQTPFKGEYRIFADAEKPITALLVEDKGDEGWFVVPVSPFSVPASEREMLVGERVLQLWNAIVLPRSVVERSWIVDNASDDDVRDVAAKIPAVSAGRIIGGDSIQAKYEKAFLLANWNFHGKIQGAGSGIREMTESAQRKDNTSLQEPSARRPFKRIAYSLAAMLMIGLGLAWFVVHEVETTYVASSRPLPRAAETEGSEYEPIAFAEITADEEVLDPIDEVAADMEATYVPDPLPAAPVTCCAPTASPVPETLGKLEPVAIISSPVKMKSMMGSRSPGNTLARNEPCDDHGFSREPLPKPKPAKARMTCCGVTTERYAEFRENEFLDPKSEPLSTFSLDVDTTSYTLMRRSLSYGRLPAKESVRLEEFVNYFKYTYAQPRGTAPIAADCELAECPWNKSHKLLRVGIQAKEIKGDDMPPCNLTFLVDCSGSMSDNHGMDLLKQGLKMLVEKLRPQDHVAIVRYASGCNVVLPSLPGTEREAIINAIDSLCAYGATSGGAGLQLAYDEAMRNFDKAANNRVILVTDGDFNVGISTPKELEEFISHKRETGIFLSVIGVGYGNYQDANMKKLANAGNGNYAYLDSLLEAKKIMVNEFSGTLFTVAKDVKVQLEFNPAEVAQYRLLGYESRILAAKDFNDDKKDAGEIGSGHSMTALYEIVPVGSPLADNAASAVDGLKYQKTETVKSQELLTVKMRWKLPDAETSEKCELAYTAADLTKETPSEDFRFASAVAEFALLLRDSKFKGDASFDDILSIARASKGADEECYRAEFIRLVESAALLAQ